MDEPALSPDPLAHIDASRPANAPPAAASPQVVDRSLPPAIDPSSGGFSVLPLSAPVNSIQDSLRQGEKTPGWKKFETLHSGTHKSADGMFQLVIEDDADHTNADVEHHRIYYSDSNVTRVELGKGRIYAAITPDSRWILIDPLDVIDVRNWRRYNLSKSLGDGYVVFLGITDDGQRMFFHQQLCPFDCTRFPVTFYELNFPRQ